MDFFTLIIQANICKLFTDRNGLANYSPINVAFQKPNEDVSLFS